jgi:hypothetical protein
MNDIFFSKINFILQNLPLTNPIPVTIPPEATLSIIYLNIMIIFFYFLMYYHLHRVSIQPTNI